MDGKILAIPKGEYNPEETYEAMDLVFLAGESWLCKKMAKGVEPIEGEYWYRYSKIPQLQYMIVKPSISNKYRVWTKLIGNRVETSSIPAPAGGEYVVVINGIDIVGGRTMNQEELVLFDVTKESGSFYIATSQQALMEECKEQILSIVYSIIV